MVAALTLFVLLAISAILIRVAAVAMRLTGLPEDVALFQAISAFTGAGFTTNESETVARHPLRRRIAAVLMVLGNLGLVSVLATVIVSLSDSLRPDHSFLNQLLWLLGVVVVLGSIAFIPATDRILTFLIGRVLKRVRHLGQPGHIRMLQFPGDHGVFRVEVDKVTTIGEVVPDRSRLLCIERRDRTVVQDPDANAPAEPGDEIYIYAPTRGA